MTAPESWFQLEEEEKRQKMREIEKACDEFPK